MTDVIDKIETSGTDYFAEDYVPPTDFGSRLPPVDIVPETTEGDDYLYVLMIHSLNAPDDYSENEIWRVVDVATTSCLSILLQFQQDILMRTKIVETKMKKILKSQENDFPIHTKIRDIIFAQTYPVDF
jgi:hypothetical protein